MKNLLNSILESFGVKAQCIDYKELNNYFYYDVKLLSNGKVKDIIRYADEISLALRAPSKPTIKALHQEGVVRIEFVVPRTSPLKLMDYFTNKNVPRGEVMCLLGEKLNGEKLWMDLSQNPHMIVAGTTGSGKSTLLHNIIGNLFNYNNVMLYLVDPKTVEFTEYDKKIKKGLIVSYSYQEALFTLDVLIGLMEERYSLLRKDNSATFPPVVLIIDEFADLILQDHDNLFYKKLCRLAQKCRAAKIFIILATQRPSVNIINGAIKANFPARIGCRVSSSIDSKVILDSTGAENLLGKGDALLKDNTRNLERFQIAHTTAQEVTRIFGEL